MTIGKRHIGGLLFAVALIFAWLDFSAFCQRAANLTVPDAHQGDAVIALTGGSGLRIAAGVRLIEAGAAPHLLVSGVHPDVTMDQITALAGGPASIYACCVTLGRVAETTAGNAAETARWASDEGHRKLIIVTSDYHMPRSLILLHRAMPELELVAYPVRSRIDPYKPLRNWRSVRGLGAEWIKWRITQARYGAPPDRRAGQDTG